MKPLPWCPWRPISGLKDKVSVNGACASTPDWRQRARILVTLPHRARDTRQEEGLGHACASAAEATAMAIELI